MGLMVISFQTKKEVPEGRWILKPTDLKGFVEIQITGGVLAPDLGNTGAVDGDFIPCKPILGLVAIDGYEI